LKTSFVSAMEKEKTKPTMRRHLILSPISKQAALIRRRSGNSHGHEKDL